MKKNLALFLLTALLAILTSGALAQDFPYAATAACTVNMRRSASGTSVVLERINEGDALTIMGESGSYYYVMYNGRTGYAMKIYVDGDKVIATAAPTVAVGADTVSGYPYTTQTTAKVNLRQYASTSSAVLTQLESGSNITVKGITGSFAQVTYGTRTGYVMTDYIVLKTIVAATPTPAPTVQVSLGYTPLSAGSTGSDVKALQQALIELGYLGNGYATGNYQSKTTAAVSACQTKNGMTATGAADASFQTLLFSGGLKNASGTITTVKVLPATGTATMRKGNYGDVVTALQQRLIALGYLVNGKATGTYDDDTIASVTAFQRDYGITADGVAGAVTINTIYAQPVPGAGTPVPTATATVSYNAPAGTIRQGTIGASATTVQLRLAQLGYYQGLADGNFGTGSVAALKAFQTRNGLRADGVCGTATKAVLFGLNALPAQDVSAPATPALPLPATPTPTVAYAAPAEKVQQGSTGIAATTVQLRLAQLGYYTGTVDGNFGSGSVAALIAFQAANGIKADGVCGSGTKAILFSTAALPVATVAPTAAVVITEENCVTIRNGTSGLEVLNMQRRLTELGFYSSRLDGQCLADDVAAIRAFQSVNGLTTDGVAGYDTQVLLYSDAAKGAVVITPAVVTPTPAAPVLPTEIPAVTYTTLRFGSSGMAVKTMQQALITLKYLTSTADGVYGNGTKAAVAAFQGNNALVSDGVAGPLTLTTLYSGNAKAAGDSSANVMPAPNTINGSIKTGDTGELVKALQNRLIELGYLSGSADGVFGMATYRALANFQTSNGLSADGIAGTQTLAKLNSSTAHAATTATPAPTVVTDIYAVTTTTASSIIPVASKVQYANWYDIIRPIARKNPYVTVYDPATGISWNVHLFSLGDHADCEPLTAADTTKMLNAFGGVVAWEPPKPVWVIFPDGQIFIATTHDVGHSPEHRTYNNFEGHVCIHFPRTASQVAAIGPYATRHQSAVDVAWKILQDSLGK